MSERAIEEATDRVAPLGTDMLPVAAAGSQVAYYVTIDDLHESIPSGTVTRSGLVQLAVTTIVADVDVKDRVVTPAGLAGNVNAKMIKGGCFCVGRINAVTLTKALIDAAFLEVAGRAAVTGDLVTTEDKNDRCYELGYFSGGSTAGWFGIRVDVSGGAFISLS
jgi:hypothetical protein